MLLSVCVNLVSQYLIYTKERAYCVHCCILDCVNLEVNLYYYHAPTQYYFSNSASVTEV